MKVKEALDVLWQSTDYITVVKVSHYIGGDVKRELLYIYCDVGENEEPERIYDENYAEKEVLSISALDEGVIEIRIY